MLRLREQIAAPKWRVLLRRFSIQVPRPPQDALHLPDSFLGMEDQHVEIDKEVFQKYHCYPSISDVKFIKSMVAALKMGAVTWWEAAGVLKRFDVRLQPFHICEILRKNIDSDASLGLFRWAEAQPGYLHDTNSYNALLRIQGYNQNFRVIQNILKEMQNKNIKKTYETFMLVVQSYFDASMVDKALQNFFEFEKCAKPKPKRKYYQYVLKRLIEFNRTDAIPIVVRGMLQVGHPADTETMNSVIHGLGASGRVNTAVDVKRQMMEKGCAADVHTYIYLISGLVKAPNMDRAPEIIADMAASGYKPNAHNFNLLLEFLLSSEKAAEALSVVKQMLLAGCCELNAESNKIIMKFLDAAKDTALGWEFYEELAKHDIYPGLITYNSLLKLLNRTGQHERALKLQERMREAGSIPDIESKNIIIQVLCKDGKTEEAMQVFKEVKKLGLKPNKVTFDVLLVGLAVNDKLLDCLSVAKKMEKSGFSPEETTYCRLIEAFSIGGLHDQAFKLFGRMKMEGFKPSVELEDAILKRRRMCLEAERKKAWASSAAARVKL